MPTVEERLASLEAKVEGMADLRTLITDARGEMNARFTHMDARFTQVDVRFTQIDARFTQVDARFTELHSEMNHRFDDVNRRIGSLDAKIDRHFVWLTGMMVTGFITVIGALVGVVYR